MRTAHSRIHVIFATAAIVLSLSLSGVAVSRADESVFTNETITNSIGMRLVRAPAGDFMTVPDHLGIPKEKIVIPVPFYIGTTEVTQGQWVAVRGTHPWKYLGVTKSQARSHERCPATYVDIPSALRFCRQLTFREHRAGLLPPDEKYTLPTQAQWEYACRAGTTTLYSFGDDKNALSKYAWWGGLNREGNVIKNRWAHEVGQLAPNPWGLYDVHGNAAELCINDTLRGGSWTSQASYLVCGSVHDVYGLDEDLYGTGFRVVRVGILPVVDGKIEDYETKLQALERERENTIAHIDRRRAETTTNYLRRLRAKAQTAKGDELAAIEKNVQQFLQPAEEAVDRKPAISGTTFLTEYDKFGDKEVGETHGKKEALEDLAAGNSRPRFEGETFEIRNRLSSQTPPPTPKNERWRYGFYESGYYPAYLVEWEFARPDYDRPDYLYGEYDGKIHQ